MDGTWEIAQSTGYRVLVTITQEDDRLSATASHSGGAVTATRATGFVNGPNFELTITWNNGTEGKYTGQFSHGPFTPPPIGFLKGETFDTKHPASRATWQSEGKNFEIV